MVGLVLVSHSRDLATALAEFARRAVAELIPIACAAGVKSAGGAGGAEAVELGTDAQAIAKAIRSVQGADGVLVLMDLGSAVLAAETALELLPEEERAGVLLCPAPLVEGAVAAAVQIAAGADLETVHREATLALTPKTGHLAGPAEVVPAAGVSPPGGDFLEATATLRNAHGLHLRPAARLVRAAAGFRAEVLVGRPASGQPLVPATSLNAVATLGLGQGEQVLFRARGPEARQALEALCRLAAERFGEGSAAEGPETAPSPAPAPAAASVAVGAAYLQGVPVSEGFAAGLLQQLQHSLLQPSARRPLGPEREWAELQAALAAEREYLSSESRSADPGAQKAELLEAFRLVLEDLALLDPARQALFDRGRNAEQALDESIHAMAGRFHGLADAYARERGADILDLGQRVLRRLRRGEPAAEPVAQLAAEPGEPRPAVPPAASGPILLAAEELSATDAAGLEPRAVLGVLIVRGGATSHASVLVRSLGIPCITGLPQSLLRLPPGTPAAMDGGQGRLWIGPDAPTLALVESGRAAWLRRREAEASAARRPAVSRDGRRFLVEANIAGIADARQAVAQGGEGVGVLRTEFLYLRRSAPPSEEEQVQTLREIAAALEGRPLTVRTLDVGGDKELPYLAPPAEANPYLGVRGIRLGLKQPELLRSQLRAVLRAAEGRELRLLFPMVTTSEELDGALEELERARASLAAQGLPHRWPIPVGMMVETPSAALGIESYLDRVDFVSLGTNDLTQYTLAAERGNPALAGYEDALHPAVLALVRAVARAASRRGKTAAVCGEIAGDPAAVPVLAGLGVGSFSLNPPGIPRVKDTLRRLDLASAGPWAEGLLGLPTAAAVRRETAAYLAALPELPAPTIA
jgi:phosphoenolpyruvate-protein phosphotransferase/dihydroxyacetone kinase phosphotransfer subunit